MYFHNYAYFQKKNKIITFLIYLFNCSVNFYGHFVHCSVITGSCISVVSSLDSASRAYN